MEPTEQESVELPLPQGLLRKGAEEEEEDSSVESIEEDQQEDICMDARYKPVRFDSLGDYFLGSLKLWVDAGITLIYIKTFDLVAEVC